MALTSSGKIAVSGLIAWDVVAPDSGTALHVSKVEVSNKNGANMEIGWGEELPIIVGRYDAGVFTRVDLSAGSMALTGTQNLAVIAPKKFDAIFVDTSVASSGASTMGVYNGTNFTSATLTATYGSVSLASGDTRVIAAPQSSWVKGGITGYENSWIMVTGSATGATIVNVRVGRIVDFVSTVADGNHAFREYSLEPLHLYKDKGLFVHTSDAAQTTSIATIDYFQI